MERDRTRDWQGGEMWLIGSRDSFEIALEKDEAAYQLAMYVQGNDILQIEKDGVRYPYRWGTCQDIIEWFQENRNYIFSDDEFPLSVSAESSAEKCEKCYCLDFDEMERYEVLQDWTFRHSWFSARAGSYLADVFFVKNGDMIEISWDNINTFQEDGIRFVFPKGKYEVDMGTFEKIIERLCALYEHL